MLKGKEELEELDVGEEREELEEGEVREVKGRAFGHKKLVVWKNIDELTEIVCKRIIPVIPKNKFKLKDQMERAVSSIGANFIEGYYSGSTKEFIKFLNYSRRSLSELGYWLNFCCKTKLISGSLFNSSNDLLIRTGYLLDRLILSLRKKLSSSNSSSSSSSSSSSFPGL